MQDVFGQVRPYENYASAENNFVAAHDLSYADPRDRCIYATIRYDLR